jgi:hypothetical protein
MISGASKGIAHPSRRAATPARSGSRRTGKRSSPCQARRDITLDELRRKLAGAGLSVAISTLHRFFARHGITRKKDRPRE